MDMFPSPQYNGKFLTNSAKPIVGVCTNTAFKDCLIQAKAKADGLVQGAPVLIKNATITGATTPNAARHLLPNVMVAEAATTVISGFVVESPNSVYLDGDSAGQFYANQIILVAPIGKGAEVWLPVKQADFSGIDIVNSTIHWIVANKVLGVGAADGTTKLEVKGAKILSQVVEGVQFYVDNGVVKEKSVAAVKIRL